MNKALRGEVWDMEFRPAVGAEIQKTRPAVVMNAPEVGRLPLCIVVPITEWKPAFAQFSWFVLLPPTPENGLGKESGADAFQVKSVSEHRLVRKLGHVTAEQAEQIAAAKRLKHSPGDAVLTVIHALSQYYLGSGLVDQNTQEIPVARQLLEALDLHKMAPSPSGRQIRLRSLPREVI